MRKAVRELIFVINYLKVIGHQFSSKLKIDALTFNC